MSYSKNKLFFLISIILFCLAVFCLTLGLSLIISGCENRLGRAIPSPSFYRDDLWCWHQAENKQWYVYGLASQCPEGTNYNFKR